MKRSVLFFSLGVAVTLLMGAGYSYWNDVSHQNKYGVLVNSLGGMYDIPYQNKYGVLVNSLGGMYDIPYQNKYGVLVNSLGGMYDIPYQNKYGVLLNSLGASGNIPQQNKIAIVYQGEIGENAQKAMVVGFVHGMAVGKKMAEESAKKTGDR